MCKQAAVLPDAGTTQPHCTAGTCILWGEPHPCSSPAQLRPSCRTQPPPLGRVLPAGWGCSAHLGQVTAQHSTAWQREMCLAPWDLGRATHGNRLLCKPAAAAVGGKPLQQRQQRQQRQHVVAGSRTREAVSPRFPPRLPCRPAVLLEPAAGCLMGRSAASSSTQTTSGLLCPTCHTIDAASSALHQPCPKGTSAQPSTHAASTSSSRSTTSAWARVSPKNCPLLRQWIAFMCSVWGQVQGNGAGQKDGSQLQEVTTVRCQGRQSMGSPNGQLNSRSGRHWTPPQCRCQEQRPPPFHGSSATRSWLRARTR